MINMPCKYEIGDTFLDGHIEVVEYSIDSGSNEPIYFCSIDMVEDVYWDWLYEAELDEMSRDAA